MDLADKLRLMARKLTTSNSHTIHLARLAELRNQHYDSMIGELKDILGLDEKDHLPATPEGCAKTLELFIERLIDDKTE